MKKNQWILHVDLISYDPKHLDNDASIELHIAYDTEKEMKDAFVQYHANIGEQFTIPGQYTIMAVEPSFYPIETEGPADDDRPF